MAAETREEVFSRYDLEDKIARAVSDETLRCRKAICEHCRKDVPIRWCSGGNGFWAHWDSYSGDNLGCCRATDMYLTKEE